MVAPSKRAVQIAAPTIVIEAVVKVAAPPKRARKAKVAAATKAGEAAAKA